MSPEDRQAREIVRQSTSRASGNRLMAGSAGSVSQSQSSPLARVDEQGQVRRLFLLDFDGLDDESKYLGDDPLGET